MTEIRDEKTRIRAYTFFCLLLFISSLVSLSLSLARSLGFLKRRVARVYERANNSIDEWLRNSIKKFKDSGATMRPWVFVKPLIDGGK